MNEEKMAESCVPNTYESGMCVIGYLESNGIGIYVECMRMATIDFTLNLETWKCDTYILGGFLFLENDYCGGVKREKRGSRYYRLARASMTVLFLSIQYFTCFRHVPYLYE